MALKCLDKQVLLVQTDGQLINLTERLQTVLYQVRHCSILILQYPHRRSTISESFLKTAEFITDLLVR